MTEQIGLFGGQAAPQADALPPETWEQIPTSASIPIPPGAYQDLDQLASHCKQ